MSTLPNISSVLDVADISQGKRKQVEASLNGFGTLSETEKLTARPGVINEVFPLVFGQNAVTESSTDFQELRSVPWSTNCWLSPKVILTPSTNKEISTILLLCQLLGSTFSIRGGGHLQNPGFTSNSGGVVISMSKFNGVVLSDDKTSVELGAGLRWLDVYKSLDEHGLAVTGGRVPSVGVSGLLLGGGLSFQNSKHGFSSMGVINYEVVLANGTIIDANAKENADLFWALKGGCTNFGVVTKFRMSTIPNTIWAEARIYPPTQNSELLDALMLYHEACEKDLNANLIWHTVNEATLLIFIYCAPVENPDAFSCFYDVPFMAKIVPPSITSIYGLLQGVSNVLSSEPLSHEMRTMSSLPDLDMYKAVEEARKEQIAVLKDVEGIILTMVIQPIASSTIKACEAKGGNPLGLTAQNHQWFLIMADWKNAKDEELVREALRKIINTAETVSKKNGSYLPFIYSNYASRDQDPLPTYGAENLQKLKDIAQKYDPGVVFQTLQNDGWLVSKAGL